jgi:hypothetical protein
VYSCHAGYELWPLAYEKLRCEDPTGWLPAVPPSCHVTYIPENDGHRVVEDPFWETDFTETAARQAKQDPNEWMTGGETYGETTDLMWSPDMEVRMYFIKEFMNHSRVYPPRTLGSSYVAKCAVHFKMKS